MESLKELIKIGEYASRLTPEFSESINEIVEFFLWLSLATLTVVAFSKMPPIKRIFQSFMEEYRSEYRDSEIVKLIPENRRKYVHWYLLFFQIAVSVVLLSGSFLWLTLTMHVFFQEDLKINRYTALFILLLITIFTFWVSFYTLKDANKIAKFIRTKSNNKCNDRHSKKLKNRDKIEK
jgi:hypothetical protein